MALRIAPSCRAGFKPTLDDFGQDQRRLDRMRATSSITITCFAILCTVSVTLNRTVDSWSLRNILLFFCSRQVHAPKHYET